MSPQSGSHGVPLGENTHAIGEQRIVGGKEREQRQRWRRKMPTFNSIWFHLGCLWGTFWRSFWAFGCLLGPIEADLGPERDQGG